MPIEVESPEETGYSTIQFNLAESSVRDRTLAELDIDFSNIVLAYGEHKGIVPLRQLITEGSDIIMPDNVLVTTGAAMALFIISRTYCQRTRRYSPQIHLHEGVDGIAKIFRMG